MVTYDGPAAVEEEAQSSRKDITTKAAQMSLFPEPNMQNLTDMNFPSLDPKSNING
jgi:hypothetical protein